MTEEITAVQKGTQRMRIMAHLKEHGTLTSLEALRKYGIMRLASRINELKKRGEPIERTIRTGQNQFGETIRYAEYRLKGGQK